MVSIIVPVYNEENNIERLHSSITEEIEKLNYEFEIVYVNDGSKDKSLKILKNIYENRERKNIKIINFTKNFGQTQALSAGFSYSKGEIIIFIDADLQNDPSDISSLISKLKQGYDVVSGWRKDRKDTLLTKKIPSKIANFLISCLTGLKIHDYGCSLKAYRSKVLNNLELFGEAHRILPAFAYWRGYSIAEVQIKHHKRKFGKSKYGLFRTFKLFLDLVSAKFFTSYSTRPNYIFGGFGIFLIAVGIGVFIWTLIYKVKRGILFSTLIMSMGLQLILMGLLADILLRIYHTTKKGESKYIIKEIIGKD